MNKIYIALGIVGAYFLVRKEVDITINTALQNKNVQAFLRVIRDAESAGEYNVLYGGGHFDDYSKHPNIRTPFHNPLKSKEGNNDFSTAAGAYQINYPTWIFILTVSTISDFSKLSQDKAAIVLLKTRGALSPLFAGDFKSALDAASGTWASLPGSKSGQRQLSYDSVLAKFNSYGGAVA